MGTRNVSLDNPNNEKYDPEEAQGTALQRAVIALGERIGLTEAEFAELRMGEILQRAEETYGDELPEFWATWKDWTGSNSIQPMGDL